MALEKWFFSVEASYYPVWLPVKAKYSGKHFWYKSIYASGLIFTAVWCMDDSSWTDFLREYFTN